MRVFSNIPQVEWSQIPAAAKWAEEAGFDGIAASELAHDLFMPLAIGAMNTSKVELATSIAVAFPRSPMIVANMAWDLNYNSKGRFTLGLGSQVKGHNERRFSVKWESPVAKMREYVESLRAIWRAWEKGEKLNYVGDHYQFTLMTPEFSPKANGLPMIPVTVAAVGPDMLKMAGRVADGVRLHGFCTRKYIENVCMVRIGEGLAKSPRSREDIEISGGGFIATGPDEAAVREKMDWVRYRVGFYGSTRTYLPVFEQHGLEELGLKLHKMSVEGKWKELASQVSDDVVRIFAAVGTYDELPKAIEQRYGGVVDLLRLDLPTTMPAGQARELLTEIKKIPTPFKGFATEKAYKQQAA